MWDQILLSFSNISSISFLLHLLGGVLLGITVGLLPALGPTAGMALLLPFIFGIEPVSALALMVGMLAVVPTGDTFTSILMGIPGSVASQATVLDGYPMARQGKAARAFGAAFGSSLIGGLFGAFLLSGFVIVARPVILSLGAGELFMLCLLGLSMVGMLSGGSLVKGLAACGLGLALGSVGGAPATAELRMSFGLEYLMDGLPIPVIALAVFAIPEIVDLIRQNSAISQTGKVEPGLLDGLRDVRRNIGLVLRCSGLGAAIGVVPGLGSSVSDWVAYGHAVQTSKDKSGYGKGEVRGVIAPESANNATTGGALIPTMLFGIPGSSSMAIFLGGMALIGMQPGPRMLETDLNITYTVVWSLALANILGASFCLMIARPMTLITKIKFSYLAPFLLLLIFIAAYQSSRSWGDLMALLFFGTMGIFMRRFGWSRPAFLMGFVLSDSVETYLYQSIQIYGWDWIYRPGVIIIAILTMLSCYFGVRFIRQMQKKSYETDGAVIYINRSPQIAFAGFVIVVYGLTFWDGLQRSLLGGVYPMFVALFSIPLGFLVLWQMVKGDDRNPVLMDEDYEQRSIGQEASINSSIVLCWLVFFIGCIFLLGFPIGALVFVFLFLNKQVHAASHWSFLGGLVAASVTIIWSQLLYLRLPTGMLGQIINLPSYLQ